MYTANKGRLIHKIHNSPSGQGELEQWATIPTGIESPFTPLIYIRDLIRGGYEFTWSITGAERETAHGKDGSIHQGDRAMEPANKDGYR